MKYLNSLTKSIDRKNYKNFLPLCCCKFETEERHKIPKYRSNRRKCDCEYKNFMNNRE